jgi:hypothetical protein
VRSRLIVLSVLAGILPASTALAASPRQPNADAGSIGVRLLDVPEDSRSDPLARSYIVDRLPPGSTIRRRVEIGNSTRSTAAVAIYAAGASLRQGNFTFAPGRGRNELSSWTSVNRGVVDVRPGQRKVATVTINVPADASSGERYAVIWAEVSAPAPAGGGVTLVNRVGVRMYISIGPGGAAPSNFAIGPLEAKRSANGEPLVLAEIHNSGRRTLDISGNLTLSDGPGGLRAGPFPVKLETALAPGDTKPVTVRLDKSLPRGPWRAQMRLRSGFTERDAAATITFPLEAGAAEVAPGDSRHVRLAAVVLLVLLAFAALVLLRVRRVRRRLRAPASIVPA